MEKSIPIIQQAIQRLPRGLSSYKQLETIDKTINLAYRQRIGIEAEVDCGLYFQLMEAFNIRYSLIFPRFFSSMPPYLYEDLKRYHLLSLHPAVNRDYSKFVQITKTYIETIRVELLKYCSDRYLGKYS